MDRAALLLVDRAELHDAQAARPRRQLEHDVVPDPLPDQRPPDRRRHGHVPLVEVRGVALGDLLIRRTCLAFSLADHGRGVAGEVAPRVAPLLGWDSGVEAVLLEAYAGEAARVFGVV